MVDLKLGVCYYPEQWPKELWDDDLQRMRALGITHVRLGEFAWTLMQPRPDQYDFSWLDDILDRITKAGLNAILCTPTAAPPAWVVEKYPQILPYDEAGRPRTFGSRHHYTFASADYLELAKSITEQLAQRYGEHPAVLAWQTDNEYGCHESARSYGPIDLAAFQRYLAEKYDDINALNAAWGNVFWSQQYAKFEQIPLPNTPVALVNPTHSLDFYRFTSEQVLAFNRAQVQILRKHAPKARITHNMMGFFTEFDHFDLGTDLDVASWDNYPLGYLEHRHYNLKDKIHYDGIGHPDISAFFHDLYRGVGQGQLWIMEQQPGPVNWARYNPTPLVGAVRFWTWQAFAHGAELVSYFRWRQVPYAQEQMHAGLLLPNSAPAPGYAEVQQVAAEKNELAQFKRKAAEVALLFDYHAAWVTELELQGTSYHYSAQVLGWYKALRRCGLNVDVVSSSASLDAYKLVLVPSLPIVSSQLVENVKQSAAHFLWGPRSGSKTEHFHIPADLPPGPLQQFVPLRVSHVATLRNSPELSLRGDGVFGKWRGGIWQEFILSELKPQASTQDGTGILYSQANHHYLGLCLDDVSMYRLVGYLLQLAKVAKQDLPWDVRICRGENVDFYFNFGKPVHALPGTEQDVVFGTTRIGRGQYAALRVG